jgi:hypothetical protein
MAKTLIPGLLAFALAGTALAQQMTFNWTRANEETVQLDPADYHTGRVYHPGPNGGNIHVDVEAKQPVTITLAWADEWNAALQHPETIANLQFRCIREHVVSAAYECRLPPDRPMVLIIHDERTPDRAVLTGIEAVITRGVKQFVSPNDLKIQYYSWTCVENCNPPQYQWFRLLKEKYEVTSTPKIYTLLTPERDGQQLSVRIKAPVPMTIAVMPAKLADQVYDKPDTLASALDETSCKQRGVQSLSFDCRFDVSDGPQSIVVLPESMVPRHKKAELELQTVKCVANCTPAKKEERK